MALFIDISEGMYPSSFELKYALPKDRTYLLYAPSDETIKDFRSFLTCCLARDYGCASMGRMDWYPDHQLNLHFGRLFCILTGHEVYRKHKSWEDWKLYFDHYINRAADVIGLPRTLAHQMLCCFQWRGTRQNQDRFLAYRTYARSIPDVAEKLYFDREVVVDAVVEDAHARSVLKDRIEQLEMMWFSKLEGPRQDKEYRMTPWASEQDDEFPKRWVPAAVRSLTSHIPYWNRSFFFRDTVHRRNLSIRDEALRNNWLSQRPRPGAPRDFWPPQFLDYVPPDPPKYSDAMEGKSKVKRIMGRRKANVLLFVGRCLRYSNDFY